MRQMKNSGIEWIQEIPSDWKIKKLKFLGILNSNGVDKKVVEGEKLYKSIHYVDVYRNSLKEIGDSDDYLIVSATDNKAEGCKLQKRDVLFTNSSETPDDIGHSTVIGEELDNILFGYHLMRFRPNDEINYKYEKYMFGSSYLRNWFSYRAKGITRYGVISDDFSSALIIVPPYKEQEQLAIFLDNKCNEVNKAIEIHQKHIDLLKTYKQSIITEAITKGINKNAEMKDSNISWIGKVPCHWEVGRIKNMFAIKKNLVYTEDREVLSLTQRGLKIKDITSNEGQLAVSYAGYQEVLIDDFVMNSMDLLTGYVDCSIYEGVTSPDYRVFQLNDEGSKRYYLYYFQMCYFRKLFYGFGRGVSHLGRWRLQREEFYKFPLLTPPIDEQEEIINYLDKKCEDIDKAITIKQGLIEKLNEYKNSLIYEAVTGKIEI